MKKSNLFFLFFLAWHFSISAQVKLNVAGKMVITETNRVATFQSTSKNAFIGLAPNLNQSIGTNLGYNDGGTNDQYFYVDTPGGDFGEFLIHSPSGNISIGSIFPNVSKVYIKGEYTNLEMGAPSFGPSGLRVTALSSFGSGGGLLNNNGTAIEAVSWEGYGLYGESQDNIAIYGSGGFDNNTNTVQADFWARRGIYGSDSSVRWKTDVKNIEDPLEKISQLRGVTFKWDEKHGGYHTVGFIAEEVGKVFPEAVFYEKNGVDAKGMDYTKLSPLLVEAVNAMRKEYQEQLDLQQKAIEEQQQQIDELKDMVEQLVAEKQEGQSGNILLEQYPEGQLWQNQPNPFHQETMIRYFIPDGVKKAYLQITTADGKVLGREPITQMGKGQILVKEKKYPAGTYFYSLVLDGIVLDTKRMVLTR